jgi:hypothetical protein
VMLDEREFLSPYETRAISRIHGERRYIVRANGMPGGNSNWRGSIWFPVNYLQIESRQKFHQYLGDDFKVECATGSGTMMTPGEAAARLSRRMTRTFLRDLVLFSEYFHGDYGSGVGASHQTGRTGVVAELLEQSGEPVTAPNEATELEGVLS